MTSKVEVILLAAGEGTRLGSSDPKAFVELAGEPMLAHSLRSFEGLDVVDGIVVLVPAEWIERTRELVERVGARKVVAIAAGGASRAASVRAGLAWIEDDAATAVLVHDAARPIVPASLVARVLAPLAEGWDAVVPALAVTDTVKQVDAAGAIIATLDRATLGLAQTPQACRASALHAALRELDEAALAALTDDAAAIEAAGGRTRMVAGDLRTRKVTTREDLIEVARVLQEATTDGRRHE
ncbi:MAG: 2-C-methyl-D-erythritol 4-phosphate cytidylyltransferase [Thermoleophilia bacterium]|nr:2-C-methyl-D-erythritol 4-phosphate cytidylyltransferase [Thermoleophilia bacterium]